MDKESGGRYSIKKNKRTKSYSNAVVFGNVRFADFDKKLKPRAAASVLLDSKEAVTDEAGAYRIVPSPGSHKMSVVSVGFKYVTLPIKIVEGDSIRIDVELAIETASTQN